MKLPGIEVGLTTQRIWLARVLIGIVFFFNVQCAIAFLVAPEVYAPGFELGGAPGEGMVRGMGILFLMWNVPYGVALWHPLRLRVSLLEALVMQAIGVLGESLLLLNLEAGHTLLRQSVGRFIIFDGVGLGLLILAAMLIFNPSHKDSP
mgnify:FL=1